MAIKQYIYACRCKAILPFPWAAIEEISIIENIEYSIALKNYKTNCHNEKWKLLPYVGTGYEELGRDDTFLNHLFFSLIPPFHFPIERTSV